jgi:hypothetical protein
MHLTKDLDQHFDKYICIVSSQTYMINCSPSGNHDTNLDHITTKNLITYKIITIMT